jgi:hypothetical protein
MTIANEKISFEVSVAKIIPKNNGRRQSHIWESRY